MGQQSIRQVARRAALAAQSTTRLERAEKDKWVQALAVRVLVAVGERDAAVADAERRAGQALRQMTQDEGLTVREAVHRVRGPDQRPGGDPAAPSAHRRSGARGRTG